MSRLPDIQLDDRRFQDLVSEARLRITRSCPEWTEHNVSDPGITLIELFAWMTEMTIYRLNRVPDKLHVTLLELLGIQLDGPSSAATDVRFRLVEPPTEPLLIPGGETEVEHPAHRARRRGRLPGARGLHDPRRQAGRLRAAARRPGQGHRRRRRRGAAPGRRPRRVRQPAGGRRRAVPRLRRAGRAARAAGRRRRLARARRRRQPRGPAAALGGLPGRQPVGGGDRPRGPHRRLQLRRRRGRAAAAAALRDPAAGRPPHALGALPHRRQDPPRRRRHDLHAGARDLLDHRRADRRAAAGVARRAGGERGARRVRRHPGPDLPAALLPRAQALAGRDARGPGPGVRRLGGVGAAARLRGLDHVRPPLHPQPGAGRDRARPRDPRDRRRLDPVRLGAAQGRGHALHQVPPRRRAQRQRRRRRADRDALRAPGRRHGEQPRPGQRRRRRRDAGPRAPARGDGDPLALPRRHRRGLRVPGRRGVAEGRARGLRPAAGHRRPGRAAPGAAADPGRPPARLRRAGAGRGAAARGLGVPRRAAPDRHDRRAAAVRLPRPVGRREPPGLAARRHRARGGGRRARALHVHQPAGGRQPDGPRARAGRSAARSTRASCTASSTPSRASSS